MRAGAVAGLASVVLLLTLAHASAPGSANVHRQNADCLFCHTSDSATLARDSVKARSLVRPDVEARCNACHGAEGPSHKTGIRPRGSLPPNLPLSSDGLITCGTCHFVHGEGDRKQSFNRIDNRRGRLCLTCHKLSELR